MRPHISIRKLIPDVTFGGKWVGNIAVDSQGKVKPTCLANTLTIATHLLSVGKDPLDAVSMSFRHQRLQYCVAGFCSRQLEYLGSCPFTYLLKHVLCSYLDSVIQQITLLLLV